MSSWIISLHGQPMDVYVMRTRTVEPLTSTPRISPRSTMLTGYSGSRISYSAARTTPASSSRIDVSPQFLVPALDLADKLAVRGPALLPSHQHVIPGDCPLVQQPAFLPLVKPGRERARDHPLVALGIVARRHGKPDLLTQRHGRRH